MPTCICWACIMPHWMSLYTSNPRFFPPKMFFRSIVMAVSGWLFFYHLSIPHVVSIESDWCLRNVHCKKKSKRVKKENKRNEKHMNAYHVSSCLNYNTKKSNKRKHENREMRFNIAFLFSAKLCWHNIPSFGKGKMQ